MKIMIATEYRINYVDGRYYVYSKLYSILKRYYNAFGPIVLCSREIHAPLNKKYFDISEMVVKVVSIKLSDTFLFLNKPKLVKEVKESDLVIGRFDSIVSCRVASIARRLKKPFFAEIMADAWDGYWNHGIIGKLLAPYMFYSTKKAVWNADYALYVTKFFLQDRYPCRNKSINASNVSIDQPRPEILDKRLSKIEKMSLSDIVLVTTAAINVEAKGQKYVIKALPLLIEKGINVKYIMIGGGAKDRLLHIAEKYNVKDNVIFAGELSIDEVYNTIDQCDLYIQPSLQEGLPRSVIEAMSRACPSIGARTAGIPELISEECVFDRKSARAIYKTIMSLLSKSRLEKQARANYEESKKYICDVLDRQRNSYFDYIKEDISKRVL